MKYIISLFVLSGILALSSCTEYVAVTKSTDIDLRYEAAKKYYYDGHYTHACDLLEGLILANKGTDRGQETLYMLAMASYMNKDYDKASDTFKRYYETYPRGYYHEDARMYAGLALFMNTPEPILDQTDTYKAITEFSNFIETMPQSRFREEAEKRIFDLQDKLIEKEYASAKLYYDLGTYFGNCTEGGSNYQACIVTAQNAIDDYPYSPRREDFAILVLRSKFDLAEQSVEARKAERYQAAAEEYYAFQNEYPESKFMKRANELYAKAKPFLLKEGGEN